MRRQAAYLTLTAADSSLPDRVVLATIVALPALSSIHMPTHGIETEEKVSAELSSSAGKHH